MSGANQLNYNGKLFHVDGEIFPLNRAINYGDGVFETIRIHNGEILFFEDHINRMLRALKALKFEIPDSFTAAFFHKQIVDLLREENISDNARIRIGVFRSGSGLYEPEKNSPEYFIEAIPMEKGYEWKDASCELGVYDDVRKNFSSISFFKSMNALPGVMAAIFKKQNNLDDCLLLNSSGKVADVISSNVFWIEKGKVFSPPVSDGGVEGVMRKNLIRLLQEHSFSVAEKSITPDELKSVDEIFLTNVGWAIKPVTKFDGASYFTFITKEIFACLIKEISEP